MENFFFLDFNAQQLITAMTCFPSKWTEIEQLDTYLEICTKICFCFTVKFSRMWVKSAFKGCMIWQFPTELNVLTLIPWILTNQNNGLARTTSQSIWASKCVCIMFWWMKPKNECYCQTTCLISSRKNSLMSFANYLQFIASHISSIN